MKNIHILPTDKPSRLYFTEEELVFTPRYEKLNGVNIYITSDEEIKEGVNQWYLDKVTNKPYNSSGAQYSSKQDVIILTTDQDLIKDGVQAIDDEFLEWFIKNPTCEEVEVEKSFYWDGGVYEYEIIFQEETVEEAFKTTYLGEKISFNSDIGKSFELGAKWQQERSYSEEEVLDLLCARNIEFNLYEGRDKVEEWFEQFKKK